MLKDDMGAQVTSEDLALLMPLALQSASVLLGEASEEAPARQRQAGAKEKHQPRKKQARQKNAANNDRLSWRYVFDAIVVVLGPDIIEAARHVLGRFAIGIAVTTVMTLVLVAVHLFHGPLGQGAKGGGAEIHHASPAGLVKVPRQANGEIRPSKPKRGAPP